jgi:hypothetical protein
MTEIDVREVEETPPKPVPRPAGPGREPGRYKDKTGTAFFFL